MRAEVLSVGTELLLGQIVNTNAQWLAQRLAELGVTLQRVTVVGDNRERIIQALGEAWSRSDVIVLTGGLGPTPDDLTHDALAGFLQVPLVRNPAVETHLREGFKRFGRDLSPSQLRQADLPQGAEPIANPVGTASGALVETAGHLVATFPGVPREMQAMWPAIADRLSGGVPIVSRSLVMVGIGEGRMAEQVADLLEGADPTVAPLAHDGYCSLRVSARLADPEPVVQEIVRRLGPFVAGERTLEKEIAWHLAETRQTVAVAESLTGGELSAALNQVPGSSDRFVLGIVAYQAGVKATVAGVSGPLLAATGPVDGNVALEMARAVRERAGTDWGLAVTGFAGPGDQAGLVYGALSGKREWVRRWRVGPLGRARVRRQTVLMALRLLQEGVRIGQEEQKTAPESGQATN